MDGFTASPDGLPSVPGAMQDKDAMSGNSIQRVQRLRKLRNRNHLHAGDFTLGRIAPGYDGTFEAVFGIKDFQQLAVIRRMCLAASDRRSWPLGTGRISPERPTSPNTTISRGNARSR